MGVYLVGYDLKHGSEADYDDLIKTIKAIGADWWHCLDSTWFIVHDGPPLTICNALLPHMHRTAEAGGDRLVVATMARNAAYTASLPQDCKDWLNKYL
jgi:hypothetical protein